jgi:uncharacterized caspase-like protein
MEPVMKKTLLGLIIAVMALAPGAITAQSTSVTDAHIQQINQQFAQKGVPNGYVVLDSYGRLELKGDYEDELQVDRAFSIAQTVVGVKWVSPVTPENIKVKAWEKKLGSLFSRAAVLQPSVRGDGPVGPIRNRYALVVGVGKFKNGITPLQYSVRDATLFYRFLLEQAGFTKNNTYFLADQNATSSNVVKYLNGIRNAAQEDDLVVVYMSSHGTPPDKFGGVYIVTYDTEVNPRERVWHTSVAETALKDFVENLKARRLVMVLDTCYSNGAYRAIPGFLPPGGKSLGVGNEDEGYGVSTAQGKRLFGAKDIVLEDQPKQASSSGKSIGSSQESYGKVLISASSAGEKSWESDQLHNSVFTYYFVDGMKRYDGSVKDAFDYSKLRTTKRVQEEKGADISQVPQAMATNENWNMRVKR